jgi:hypothetical protein
VKEERGEIFADGMSLGIKDFRERETYRGGKRSRFKTPRQDKGFPNEIGALVRAI